ncbi:hypothetical protein GCM10027442_37770 [Emticicia fontis]
MVIKSYLCSVASGILVIKINVLIMIVVLGLLKWQEAEDIFIVLCPQQYDSTQNRIESFENICESWKFT